MIKLINICWGALFFIAACSIPDEEKNIPTPDNNTPAVGCTDPLAKNFKTTASTDDCSCQYDFNSTIAKPTLSSFTQKVLVEVHTGTWCGWCPISKETIEKVSADKNVVGVEIHYNDKLTLLDEVYVPLKNIFGHPAFPSAMVNRKRSVVGTTVIMGDSEWDDNIDAILKTPKTNVGLALETKLVNGEVQVMSQLKFNSPATSEVGLGLYLVETDVSGYPQLNYLSKNAQFKQYNAYNLPSEIADIKHKNVVRAVIAPHVSGKKVPSEASVKLKAYPAFFKLALPTNVLNPLKCKVVAFVIDDKHQILNLNYCDLGAKSDWN
jgi:thiol-disulfide isomerase/thioredoxin